MIAQMQIMFLADICRVCKYLILIINGSYEECVLGD